METHNDAWALQVRAWFPQGDAWVPQEDAWVFQEGVWVAWGYAWVLPGRRLCFQENALGCPSMPGADAWVLHRDVCMLQETPRWLAERLGCSREVLEYPTQVTGCSGEIFGCLSKLLVQHGEVLVRTKAVMGDTE